MIPCAECGHHIKPQELVCPFCGGVPGPVEHDPIPHNPLPAYGLPLYQDPVKLTFFAVLLLPGIAVAIAAWFLLR